MKRKFTRLTAALALLACLAIPMGMRGQASVGTTLWSETWQGGTAGEKPSDYGFEGTTVYGGATLTYAQSNTNTKLYDESLAEGEAPELLLSSGNNTWTISNIPTGQATGMSLTFLSNKTTFNVSTSTDGVSVSGSAKAWTIDVTGTVSNFDLIIKNTGSKNARIDNIALVVTTAGGGSDTYTVTFDCDGGEGCPDDMTGIEPGANNFTVPNDIPTKEHYTFDEFYLGSDDEMYEPGETYTISSDLELTASWTINKYNVAMTSDGTDAELYAEYGNNILLAEDENADINYGTELTLHADDVPAGHIVVWTITNTATQANVTEAVLNGSTVTVPDYNITITGVVTPFTSYTITFVVPTGAPAVESIVGYDGQTITLPTAQPSQACAEDWTFAGWATQSISETTTAPELLTGSYTIENNAILYAVYKQGGSSNCSVTFSESGYTSGDPVTEAEIGDCADATFAQGTNTSNAPKYYDTGAAIRLYGGNTMTITGNLSAISLSFASGEGSNTITTNVGSYENGTWTGNANSVTFTIGGTSGHRRIAGIAVTAGGGTITYNSNPVCQDQVATPTFSLEEGTYNEEKTTTISCTTGEVEIYYTTNGDTPTTASTQYTGGNITIDRTMTLKTIAVKDGMDDSEVASATYTLKPYTPSFDPVAGNYEGTQQVTITSQGATITYRLGESPTWLAYEGPVEVSESTTLYAKAHKDNWTDSEASAAYTIIDPNAPGSQTHPYTVAEARAAIDANTGLTGVYATGIISRVTSYNSNYHSITYWISDDGTQTDELQVYSGKGLNNADFSSISDVEVGAIVVVYGNLKKHNNTTYEFDYNNYLTSYRVPAVINAEGVTLAYNVTYGSFDYTIDHPVENQSLTATLQEGIDWITEITAGESAVTFHTAINEGDADRTATITLSYEGADDKVVVVKQRRQIVASATATITFGNGEGDTNINGTSVSGTDSRGNTWTITTVANNPSFTPNADYAQVGTSNNPATSIMFNTTFAQDITVTDLEAKFGGFDGTSGDINLFVGTGDGNNAGTGALNGAADVIVQSTSTKEGTTISVTVSNITNGVKCYYISYSFTNSYIDAESTLQLAYNATEGNIAYGIVNPVEGGVLTASVPNGSWLTLNDDFTSPIAFTCSANEATSPRETTVTLTYKDANNETLATKAVVVSQDRVPKQDVTMAFNPTAAMATLDVSNFTEPTLTTNPSELTVTYSSSNTNVATVDESTGEVTIVAEGQTVITATFAGNDDYNEASALYTLFVVEVADPNIPILRVEEDDITQTTAPVMWTPCPSVTSYTLEIAPVAISESFEGGAVPQGWISNGTIISSGKGGDGTYCIGFNGSGDNIITPALSNPKAISFMYKRSGNTATWSLNVSYATSLDAETWTSIGTVSDVSADWQTFSASLNVTEPVYIKFTDTRSDGGAERYIDLVQIAGDYTSQSVTGTSHTFENLAAGATYYARVKGNSEYSNVVSFTTLPFTLDIAGYGNSDGGWHLIAIPVNENVTPTTANGFIAQTAENYDLYIFDESQTLEWRNYKEMDGNNHVNFSTLESGKGYLYASKYDTQLAFTGTPYSGTGQVELSKSDNVEFSGLNLIGNPFATTAYFLDANSFYEMNADGDEIIPQTDNAIAAMEGVFVVATENGGTVTFTTTAPQTAKSSISANLSSGSQLIDRAIIRFDNDSQLPKFMLNPNNTKLYITQDDKDFAVVNSNAQGEMPVSFKASKNGTYTISVEPENVEMNYLHLIDNRTGADVDLLATPSYTFEANTTDYASRFRLVFNANDENGASTGSATFAFFNGSEWVISNMGEATLQVVDVMGRVLSTETVNGNAAINLNQTPGVYMFRLVNGDSVKVQKVVVR